jgi:N-acetylglucosamine kinase-like BadF-type ATPase
MEALAAISLAGNVVQFVQVTGQLISEAAAIKRNGEPSSLPQLRNLAANVTKQAGVIKSRLQASGTAQALTEENQVSHRTEREASSDFSHWVFVVSSQSGF